MKQPLAKDIFPCLNPPLQLELFAMAVVGLTLGHVAFDVHCWRDASSHGGKVHRNNGIRGFGSGTGGARREGSSFHGSRGCNLQGGVTSEDSVPGEMESLDPCCAT